MDRSPATFSDQEISSAVAHVPIRSDSSRGAGLSVVVNFFNMPREAKRTLFSLSRPYQQLPASDAYEVIAVDNGSTAPLTQETRQSLAPEFRYHFVECEHPSPCLTINRFVEQSRFENVMILIDGARMLSPGVVGLTSAALRAFDHPFIYTIGMHVGPKVQNQLVAEGYDSMVEDALIQSVDWQANGYLLFTISTPGMSSKGGFFSQLSESNCFTMRKCDFARLGGYEPRFTSPGGGLCNLDFFNRVHEADWLQPVLLLGEASFHQFHGGVATNAALAQHPWTTMESEYAGIVGKRWKNGFRPPLYLGSYREECAALYTASARIADR